jgi:glutamate synthase domain-containing protein 1
MYALFVVLWQENIAHAIGDFERALFVIRKHVSHNIRTDASLSQALLFYVCSLSTTVIIYKGMLMGSQVLNFYTDLSDPKYSTYLAMVHSRFSTNTFPSTLTHCQNSLSQRLRFQ